MNALLLSLLVALAPGADVERTPHWYAPTPATTSSTTTAAAAPQLARIVSLAPVITETLYALGKGDSVVGVTRFCDRPREAQEKTAVGGYTDASLEQILALKPDTVIAMPSLGQRQLLDRLREHGVSVYVVFTDSLVEQNQMIAALGALLGQGEAAARLLAAQQQVLDGVRARGSGKGLRVVVVVGHDPLVVAGRGSFADTALRATGAASALKDADPQWPQWSLEALLARQVDVVVAAEGGEAARALRAALAPLGARAPRVVAVDSAILMRPGPSFKDDVAILETLLAQARAEDAGTK